MFANETNSSGRDIGKRRLKRKEKVRNKREEKKYKELNRRLYSHFLCFQFSKILSNLSFLVILCIALQITE